jgi:hypothetical protein
MTQLTNFDTPSIRKDSENKFSVYDSIAFIAQKKNERMVWKRLVEQHPEIVTKINYHVFPGGNGKPTPVASREVISEIIALLPSENFIADRASGFVYLISAKSLPIVKIGKSHKPVARMAQHQIGSPVKLSLIATFQTKYPTEMERDLKTFFKPFHSHGEWYKIGQDKALELFHESVNASDSFLDAVEFATPSELTKMAMLMEWQYKALKASDARGHSEISNVIQLAANDFQAMLERFGVV